MKAVNKIFLVQKSKKKNTQSSVTEQKTINCVQYTNANGKPLWKKYI